MAIILVSGALANKLHNGGAAWTRLSWALGLKSLGLEVAFVEQIRAESCVDATGRPCRFEDSANRQYFREVTEQFGLSDLATLVCDDGPTQGLTTTELDDLIRSASALVNITGHWTHARMGAIPCKIYIDLDPGYTQFWHAMGDSGPHLEGHNFYYTVGENIGRPVAPSRPAASPGGRSGSRWCWSNGPCVPPRRPIRSARSRAGGVAMVLSSTRVRRMG